MTRPTSLFERVVRFGGWGPGSTIFSLGCQWERVEKPNDIEPALDLFLGKRLLVKIRRMKNGDNPDQQTLPGLEEPEYEGTVDCEKMTIGTKTMGPFLRFKADETMLSTFYRLQNSTAMLTVLSSEEAEEEEESNDESRLR